MEEYNIFNQKRYKRNFVPNKSDQERIKIYLDMIGTDKKILDVGCGMGYISNLMVKKGNFVVGLDVVDGDQNEFQNMQKINFDLRSDWCQVINEKFDIVLAAEIIEHLFDTDKFLQNIYNVLKDDGILIISTPNVASLGRRLMLLLGFNPNLEFHSRINTSGHIRYFTLKNLIILLKENNFSIIDYSSNIINLTPSSFISSVLWAKIFPTFGTTLIIKAKKENNT